MLSTVEEIAHELRHSMGLFEMRQVAGAVDQLDVGARDPLRELVGVRRCDHLIRIPPDDQRRRGYPVDAFLETLVRERPNEFPGACLRPDKAGLRLDAVLRIGGKHEEPLRRNPGGVGKERRAALVLREDHPVLDRHIVQPEAERVDQNELCHSPRHCGGDLASEHAAKRVADYGCRIKAQTVEQLTVIDDEVPQLVELMDRTWIPGRRSGVARHVDPISRRQVVEKVAVAAHPPRAV